MAGYMTQWLKVGAFAALCGLVAVVWLEPLYAAIVATAVFFFALGLADK